MDFKLPDIPAEERTPLVLQLLDLLQQQQVLIQQLRDEIARLKGQTRRPKLAPSRLEQTPKPKPPEGTPQPGGPKVAKNAQLRIDAEVTLLVAEPPAGSVVKGYEEYLVQELRIEPRVTRYLRQRVVTPDGRSLLAPLPADVLPGSHYGPRLRAFLLHQHHHNGVTQPLLLGQLHEWGIVISAGQLNHLLTEGHEAFHREKQELLPAGLIGAAYIQVDDTTARHQGQNGFCTHLGNERFAYFESTDSKSRQNFLEILRQPHTDYVINEMALAYWQRQGLSAEVVRKLCQGAQRFADKVAWQARLQELGIAAQRYVRLATEGALLGSLIEHGVSAQLRVLSDGAEQYNVLVHAACWVHAERPLARLEPFGEEHRVAIAVMREQIWELYQENGRESSSSSAPITKAPSKTSTAPGTRSGHGWATSTPPAPARTSALKNGRASTTPWRRASKHTCSSGDASTPDASAPPPRSDAIAGARVRDRGSASAATKARCSRRDRRPAAR